MPHETPASQTLTPPETFPQACTRLIFLARDDCVKGGSRITPQIVERIIQEQSTAFNLIPAKPILIDGIAEAIYKAYPRHEGKKAALKAIAVAMRGIPSTDLLKITMEYAKAVSQWPRSFRYTKEDRDIVPFPQKWFNQGRYMDDQSAWVKGEKKQTSGVNYSKF